MWVFLQTPVALAVIWVTLGWFLGLVSFYVLRRIRDRTNEEVTTVDHLTNFREMTSRGVLAEGEFRTIKTTLGEKLKKEFRRDEDGSETALTRMTGSDHLERCAGILTVLVVVRPDEN